MRYSTSRSNDDRGYLCMSTQQRPDKTGLNDSRVRLNRSVESSDDSNLAKFDSDSEEKFTAKHQETEKKKKTENHKKTEKGRRDDTTDLIEELGRILPCHFLVDLLLKLNPVLPEVNLKNLKSISNNRRPAKNSVLEQTILYILAVQDLLAEFFPIISAYQCAKKSHQGKTSETGHDVNDNGRWEIISRVVKIAKFRAQHGKEITPDPDN